MSAGNDLRPFRHDATYDAERAARLIRQLMLFHKDEEMSNLRIDALDLLRKVVDVCRGVFPRDIDFHVDAPERLPALRGHRDQLRQCIVNLCAMHVTRSPPRRTAIRVGLVESNFVLPPYVLIRPRVSPARERGQAWPICDRCHRQRCRHGWSHTRADL
ncbi:MAG: hypothetical protein QF402_05185 [Candidatus Latescibacteria bacterium]|nr:hypothetical protein [Candidatus Latescibacterota bacterium]